MQEINILWADDEIDLLKPYILFLNDKGYKITTTTNGTDALQLCKSNYFDLIFLDENMPGPSGLEVLNSIKNINPELPVIMITKSEEEQIMENAIGSKISDYLIKPVNPNQILLAIKKVLDNKRLISQKTTTGYLQEFRNIGMSFNEKLNHKEWVEIYKKLIYWELELEKSTDVGMNEVFLLQKAEANVQFCKFIEKNYPSWTNPTNTTSPILSHTIFAKKIAPLLSINKPVFCLVIDNLRFDQWKILQPLISELFRIDDEDLYYSILPTSTQFSRNSFFAGLLPLEIQKKYPHLWEDDISEEGKNLHEETFLIEHLQRSGINIKSSYNKITNINSGKSLSDNVNNLLSKKLNVIVYNFVDMLSHARNEMEIIKELANNEAAYRSITLSWFEHSPLFDTLKQIAKHDVTLIITTDHGSIRVKKPSKTIGDKNTSTNLRYKQGKHLQYNPKEVLSVTQPELAGLPKSNITSSYIFAKEDKYFVYPNNYNYYVNFYNNTFQHGGISMEEMLIPFITLNSK